MKGFLWHQARVMLNVVSSRSRRLTMKITITAHTAAESGDKESHCFHFLVEDDGTEARTDSITLRTARVFVRELANHTGLDAMMRKIVATSESEYGTLIGACFEGR